MFRNVLNVIVGVFRTVGLTVRLLLHPRVPWKLKLILPAALLYVVSPIDIIPEIVPVLGLVDDLVACVIALTIFVGLGSGYVAASRLNHGKKPRRPANANIVEVSSYEIDEDEQKDKT